MNKITFCLFLSFGVDSGDVLRFLLLDLLYGELLLFFSLEEDPIGVRKRCVLFRIYSYTELPLNQQHGILNKDPTVTTHISTRLCPPFLEILH